MLLIGCPKGRLIVGDLRKGLFNMIMIRNDLLLRYFVFTDQLISSRKCTMKRED